MSERVIDLVGIYETTGFYSDLYFTISTLKSDIAVVRGLTCQGLVANLTQAEEGIRAGGSMPLVDSFAINGNIRDGLSCAEDLQANYPYALVLVYLDQFLSVKEAARYTKQGIVFIHRDLAAEAVPREIANHLLLR
jgi:hypothetical protein